MKTAELTLILLFVSLLAVCRPVEAWYKQAARPSYYSVGRASGLLSRIRRSKPELEPIDRHQCPARNKFSTRLPQKHDIIYYTLPTLSLPICVKDVFPELQSCEFFQDSSLFKCGASVIFSLDSRICLNTGNKSN
uniref:Uncharacterized protein n=1 Tax=Cyprinus carpio TaxID=7962 RepID=A0A8C2CWA2_CYPCA